MVEAVFDTEGNVTPIAVRAGGERYAIRSKQNKETGIASAVLFSCLFQK